MHVVNRMLGLFGLRVSKVSASSANGQPQASKIRDTVAPMRVGKFDILMPPGHPAFEIFQAQPGFMSELGRIAAAVYSRYPDMIAVDVGANIGDTAAVIRSSCPSPIICVEGDPTLQELLATNTRMVGDTTTIPCFLSDAPESKYVEITKQGWNSTLVPSANRDTSTQIQFTTLDEALSEFDIKRIKLLKIDTEGFDGKVMRGSRKIMSHGKPAIFFEYNRENMNCLKEDGIKIFNFAECLGYRRALIWDECGRLLCGTTLDNSDLLCDLDGYVDFNGKYLGKISYLDICIFHSDDDILASELLTEERAARDKESNAEITLTESREVESQGKSRKA